LRRDRLALPALERLGDAADDPVRDVELAVRRTSIS
jgi:hypothetical protein